MHGTNVSIVDNTIRNNWFDGLSIGGASNVFVANWDRNTGIVSNAGGGISISQGADSASARPVESVVIDSANITGNHNFGIWFHTIAQPLNRIAITNSCIQGNDMGALSISGLGPEPVFKNNATSGCGN